MKKIKPKMRGKDAAIYYYNIENAYVIRAEWQKKKTVFGKQPFTVR